MENENTSILDWWVKYVRVRIQVFFKEEGRETARERRNTENFYYACIYDLLREPPATPAWRLALNFSKKTSALFRRSRHISSRLTPGSRSCCSPKGQHFTTSIGLGVGSRDG
jgi:hypothetical protein